MTTLVSDLLLEAAIKQPHKDAVIHKKETFDYTTLANTANAIASGLNTIGLNKGDRVGIYLPKQPETVISFFATNLAGGIFVPINPMLKQKQVKHILSDCNVRVLITSKERYKSLENALKDCHDLNTVVLTSDEAPHSITQHTITWKQLASDANNLKPTARIDTDAAAILYTSGSTGNPKGVVVSNKNIVAGAQSVASYLNNTKDDRLLAVLPFSFDYGLSQLTTALYSQASVVLMDYLFPNDIIKTIINEKVTGLAGVPPLWNQLAQLEWPAEAQTSLRYITNSGGAMPTTTLDKLRTKLPDTQVYLMYGLTEAFRSTYLPPDEIDAHPNSIGKAIPNARVTVVREDGTPCNPNETGELVHEGSLVALGYWNDVEKTAERFKPAPNRNAALCLPEIAVWSGDYVKMDEDGYLYFVGRKDEMIKTSGFRVSPSEVEETIYTNPQVHEAVALGIPHPQLGQGILVIATPVSGQTIDSNSLHIHCKQELPNFMIPHAIEICDALPRTPNGKIDRKQLANHYQDIFA